MEIIRFECGCGKQLKVVSHFAGREGNCPACGGAFIVPNPEKAFGATPVVKPDNARNKSRSVLIAMGALVCFSAFCLMLICLVRAFVGGSREHRVNEGTPGSVVNSSPAAGEKSAGPTIQPTGGTRQAITTGPSFTIESIVARITALPEMAETSKKILEYKDGRPGQVLWDEVDGGGLGIRHISVFRNGDVLISCYLTRSEVFASSDLRSNVTIMRLAAVIRGISGNTMANEDIVALIVSTVEQERTGRKLHHTPFTLCGRRASIESASQDIPGVGPSRRDLYGVSFGLKGGE
ncbi:MAG: hypothetical protein JWN24_4070 [Phycisphaerales bacterium]|nr:hypothetical protein [Phycisphaerales bacterium]